MTTRTKYPRTIGRMRRDVSNLRRAVELLASAAAYARKTNDETPRYESEAIRHAVSKAAWEVERLATCIRADALDFQTAANDDGYGQ